MKKIYALRGLLTLCLVILFSAFSGGAKAQALISTFKDKNLGTEEADADIWVSSVAPGSFQTAWYGAQVGTSKAPAGTFTLQSTKELADVSKVVFKGGTGGTCTIVSVTVGDATFTPENVTMLSKQANANTSYEFTGSGSGIITINFNASAAACYLSCVEVYYAEKVKSPVFSVSTQSFLSPFDVTISADGDAAYLLYTTNGDTPEEGAAGTTKVTGQTATVNIAATTTLKAVAVDGKGNKSAVTSATYTQLEVLPSIAALRAATTTTTATPLVVRFTDAVVTYTNGNNAYIEDATGGVLLYLSNHNLKAGDKLNGVVKTEAMLYSGMVELCNQFDTTDATITPDSDIPETLLTVDEVLNNMQRYESCRVKLTGVQVTSAFEARNATVIQGDLEINIFDKVNRTEQLLMPLGATVTMIAYPNTYINKGDTLLQLNIWKQSDLESITMPLSVNTDEGYDTYYTDHALKMPEGLTGAVVTAADGDELTLDYSYTAGAVVPAHTALLLKGTKGVYTYEVSTAKDEAPADNLLRGTLTDAETTGEDGDVFFQFTRLEDLRLGFYYGAADGAAFTNSAHKAYLALPAATASAAGYLIDGEAAGIENILGADSTSAVYTLAGVRVTSDRLPAGIYVKNGRKVIIK